MNQSFILKTRARDFCLSKQNLKVLLSVSNSVEQHIHVDILKITGQVVWMRRGNQGQGWLLGQATISSTASYQIAIEGVIGSGYYGDIAIDDIRLLPGTCNEVSCFVNFSV